MAKIPTLGLSVAEATRLSVGELVDLTRDHRILLTRSGRVVAVVDKGEQLDEGPGAGIGGDVLAESGTVARVAGEDLLIVERQGRQHRGQDTGLGEAAGELAARIADSTPQVLGQARRLVRDGWGSTRPEAGTAEVRAIAQAVTSQEATARIEAFVARGR